MLKKGVIFLIFLHLVGAAGPSSGLGNHDDTGHEPNTNHQKSPPDSTPPSNPFPPPDHPPHPPDHSPPPHPTPPPHPSPSSVSTPTVNALQEINNLYENYTATMCKAILHFDCRQHIQGDSKVCGSDHREYLHCDFARARCLDPNLIVSTDNSCSKSTTVTVPSQTEAAIAHNSFTLGHDPSLDLIKDVFCKNLHSISCGSAVDADICTTDGKVFRNECLYAKVKCYEPNLKIANPSHCGEHGLNVHSTPKPDVPLFG